MAFVIGPAGCWLHEPGHGRSLTEAIGTSKGRLATTPSWKEGIVASLESKSCSVHTRSVTLVFQLLQQDIHLFTQLFLIVEQVWSLVCEEVASRLHDVGPQVGVDHV